MDPVIIPELQERDIHTIGTQNKFTWNVEGASSARFMGFRKRCIFKWSKEGREDQKRSLCAEVIASFIGEKLGIKIQKSHPARCTINEKR